MKLPFSRLSFSRQFMLAIIAVLLIGMAIIGTWMGRQIENSAVNRAAAIAAVYVESILAAQLHDWSKVGEVGGATHAVLDRIFIDGPLRRKVLSFKLWDVDGRIIYSSDHAQLGQHFQIETKLAAAFAGTVQARISDLHEADNVPEQERWPQLLEVYVPVRTDANGKIIAVAEFYHSMESLGREIHTAQQRSWLLVAVATVAIYLVLLSLVRRANTTILDQQRDLRQQLQQLRVLLDENDRMRERLSAAGASTTALNEEFLHRIAADLHDGPAQTMAFALMRFDELAEAYSAHELAQGDTAQDLKAVHGALQSSLRDVRNIAAGLAIPGIADLSLGDTARRAVHDFERISGLVVRLNIDDPLGEAALAIKITLYRLLQESLTNSWRHAQGDAPQVHIHQSAGQIGVEITDQGIGFDLQVAAKSGRLGLALMRERVRLLGGTFEIDSAPRRGTHICATIPLSKEDTLHG